MRRRACVGVLFAGVFALLKLDFDTAIPGHGPAITKSDVRVFRDKMQTLNQRMTAFIASGGGRQDIASRILHQEFEP